MTCWPKKSHHGAAGSTVVADIFANALPQSQRAVPRMVALRCKQGRGARGDDHRGRACSDDAQQSSWRERRRTARKPHAPAQHTRRSSNRSRAAALRRRAPADAYYARASLRAARRATAPVMRAHILRRASAARRQERGTGRGPAHKDH